MSDTLDCVVIGAGVVGLAIARNLAISGREVYVLEAENAIGTITSARNSEVIHAGLYYPQGSLKGQLCVRGKGLLYEYLEQHGVEHQRCGKLVVATTDNEITILNEVIKKASANGCTDLQLIEGAKAQALEPGLTCLMALSSPSTGIVDSHAYMLSLQGEIEAHGGAVALNAPVLSGAVHRDGILLQVGGVEPMEILCTSVINSTGLDAQKMAGLIDGFPQNHIPPSHLCKGNYFSLSGKAPFSRLIYPVPGAAGLGCHYTRDLGGQGRFGPDTQWVEDIDYVVDPARGESFYAQIRRYWPDLEDGALIPAYSGMRPKIQAPGQPAFDFAIEGSAHHGVKGLVNLFGIESPGLTASLAIAERVEKLLA
ncbi:MAG: NAD(P)/FAD-dependent oxidoreductase [Magnetovibrio sp.]|nr:NAD(P)/FAD-dependent oxidoreductase [Magnetovibrio sp.]